MNNWSNEEKQKIDEFLIACTEMIEGKFILSDTKVAKILKCIATSDHLYDLFGKCLVGFDFKEEFKRVTDGTFCMPQEQSKIIAFVFCFLLEVDNKRVSLQTFVNEQFYNKEGYNVSYQNFALTVLVPFKESVIALLNINEREDVQEDVEETIFENEEIVREEPIYQDLKRLLSELLITCKQSRKINPSKLQSLEMVVCAMHEALKLENWRILNGLFISLDLLLEKEKSVASSYAKIKQCVYDYYYSR